MVDTLIEARLTVSKVLKKRFSASRREGKRHRPPYSLIEADIPKDFPLSDWLHPPAKPTRTQNPSLIKSS
jgi:hypothetical protein